MTLEDELPAAYRLLRYDEIDSTSDEAKTLAEAGAEHGVVVWAASQRKGRGRRGNDWQSPPGNLYASLLLRPDRTPAQALQLSFVASLALADAITAVVPARCVVTCKWPNDVFLNHRKTAGLLLESSTSGDGVLDWLVIARQRKDRREDSSLEKTRLRIAARPQQPRASSTKTIANAHFCDRVDFDRWCLVRTIAPNGSLAIFRPSRAIRC